MASVTEEALNRKRARARAWETKRRACTVRLRIALSVLEDYGLLDRYELLCRDEGIEHPLHVPHGRQR